MELFTDAPHPKLIISGKKSQNFELHDNQLLVGSGKSGINLILGYLRTVNSLISKNSEILVPHWMGQWVYIAMLHQAIPVYKFSNEVKCMYVYHQFGFLQEMDAIVQFANENNLLIIEDSAHLLKIENSSSRINFFGHYSLSSPPKFISSPPIGLLESNDPGFNHYVRSKKNESSKINPYVISLRQNFIGRLASIGKPNKNFLDERNYKLYSSYLFNHNTTQNAIRRLPSLVHEYEDRLKRIEWIYSQFEQHRLPIMTSEQLKVAVLKVPIFVSDNEVELLSYREPWAINYLINFDRNQNLLKSNYQKAITVPMHAQINDSEFENAIAKLASILR